LKTDASFCYCNDISAIHTSVVVRTTPQSAIVVGSTHCKHKQSSADEVQGHAITQFRLQRYCTKTFKGWQFICTRVHELDQILIAWNMQKACRNKPRFTC